MKVVKGIMNIKNISYGGQAGSVALGDEKISNNDPCFKVNTDVIMTKIIFVAIRDYINLCNINIIFVTIRDNLNLRDNR